MFLNGSTAIVRGPLALRRSAGAEACPGRGTAAAGASPPRRSRGRRRDRARSRSGAPDPWRAPSRARSRTPAAAPIAQRRRRGRRLVEDPVHRVDRRCRPRTDAGRSAARRSAFPIEKTSLAGPRAGPAPARVTCTARCRGSCRAGSRIVAPSRSGDTLRASPKSRILSRPSPRTIRLSGFKSR